MSLTSKVAQNTIIQIIGKVVSTALGLATVGLMTRYLGREGFGWYTTVTAFLQFFGILVDMGLSMVIIQLISETPEETEKITKNIFTFRLISAIIFLGLAPFVVLFFPYPAIIKWGVALTALSFLFISLNQIIISLFQKYLRMDKVAIAEIIGRLVLLAGVILVVYFGWGFLPVMGMIVLGSLVNLVANLFFVRRYVTIGLAFDFAVWKKVWLRTWPIALSIAFNLVYFKADTIILSLYWPQTEVGIYGATYKVLEVLTQLTYLFMGLILPIYSAYWASQNFDKFKQAIQKAFDFTSIITWPMVVGGFFLAGPIMIFVAGADFSAAAPILQILIFATGTIFITNVFTYAVVAANLQKKMLWGFILAAIFGLAGYLLLIPTYSYFGAAGMTVAVECFITLFAFLVVYRTLKFVPSFIIFGKALLASLVMGVAVAFLVVYQINLLVVIVLGALIYTLILFLLGGYQKETVREILNWRG
ncbi:MAG: flippase [Patescibacteria group bacterium]